MRSAPAIALVLLASTAIPTPARAGEGLDVEVLKGTFEAHQHDETPEAGTVDDRKLTDGTLELHRIGPGHWRGTATATLGMEWRLDAQGVITTAIGHGTESGTVDLVLDVFPPGAYHLTWSLATIPGRTTVDIPASNIHQSSSTSVAYAGNGGFESHGVLPAEGGDLVGKNESDDPAHYRLVKWRLKVDELRAVPRVDAIERGQEAHLDGTASTGHITRYEWKLDSPGTGAVDEDGTPNGECPVMPEKKLQGATADPTLLCTMKVTLTVYDGDRASAPVTVEATVRPRKWKTTFDAKPPSPEFLLPVTVIYREHREMGREMCSIGHGTSSMQDSIHRDTKTGPWNGSAYVLDTVHDADSPFDGWTWASENRSRFLRRILLNPELKEGSDTSEKSAHNGHAADFARLRRCTIQHETKHYEKEKTYIQAHDPARIVERTFGPDSSVVDALAGAAASRPRLEMSSSNYFEAKVHDDLRRTGCGRPGKITDRLLNAPLDVDGKPSVVWVEDDLGPISDLGD